MERKDKKITILLTKTNSNRLAAKTHTLLDVLIKQGYKHHKLYLKTGEVIDGIEHPDYSDVIPLFLVKPI